MNIIFGIDNIHIDIYIKKFNTVIEIYGDFWHANPNKYKENDELNMPRWINYGKRYME